MRWSGFLLAFLLFIGVLPVPSVLAQTAPSAPSTPRVFQTSEELSAWMAQYYKSPEPERVAQAMEFASQQGYFKKDSALPPFFGFLAGGFSKNWSATEPVTERLLALVPQDQAVLVLGLWYSGLPEAKAKLRELAPRMPTQEKLIASLVNHEPLRLTEIPLEQGAWVLDALWGNFSATGDEAPVKRVIAALTWANATGNFAVGGAAKWSLTSNALKHPRVLEICRAELARQSKEAGAPLAQVLREVAQQSKQNKEKNAVSSK